MKTCLKTGYKRFRDCWRRKCKQQLRETLGTMMKNLGGEVFYPQPQFCTDNGAMICLYGLLRLKQRVSTAISPLMSNLVGQWPNSCNLRKNMENMIKGKRLCLQPVSLRFWRSRLLVHGFFTTPSGDIVDALSAAGKMVGWWCRFWDLYASNLSTCCRIHCLSFLEMGD